MGQAAVISAAFTAQDSLASDLVSPGTQPDRRVYNEDTHYTLTRTFIFVCLSHGSHLLHDSCCMFACLLLRFSPLEGFAAPKMSWGDRYQLEDTL